MSKEAVLVVVFKDTAGEWRWTARDENYDPVAHSRESYAAHDDALAAAKSLFPEAEIEDDTR